MQMVFLLFVGLFTIPFMRRMINERVEGSILICCWWWTWVELLFDSCTSVWVTMLHNTLRTPVLDSGKKPTLEWTCAPPSPFAPVCLPFQQDSLPQSESEYSCCLGLKGRRCRPINNRQLEAKASCWQTDPDGNTSRPQWRSSCRWGEEEPAWTLWRSRERRKTQ